MLKPDYKGGSLLNLMTTLGTALGLPSRGYAPLAPSLGLDSARLAQSRQIVLLIIDGLGDELLTRLAPDDSLLAQQRIGRLTSVFPSTTASAIPTFLTGLPPQAHGLTGWHMWFEEIEQILAVLPLTPRGAPPAGWVPATGTLPERLFAHRPLSQRLEGRAWSVAPQDIIESPFNHFHSTGARRIGYRGTAEFFTALETAVGEAAAAKPTGRPGFIHAYYPVLDGFMHVQGTRDVRIAKQFAKFEAGLAAMLEGLAGTDTTFIVTADHGFIDAPPERLIELDAHPELNALLARPLCGERRIAYAYVLPAKRADFAAYVSEHLAHACELHTTPDFIAAGWFGVGPAHPQLASRAGDFVLLMKDDWTIKDWLPEEKRYAQPGVHGGASEVEMRVPLIVVDL